MYKPKVGDIVWWRGNYAGTSKEDSPFYKIIKIDPYAIHTEIVKTALSWPYKIGRVGHFGNPIKLELVEEFKKPQGHRLTNLFL